jgi:hypothetical protein
MPHARKQIRDAVVAMLADLQTTGRNVYPSRIYSLDESELPSLSVFTVDEGSDEVVTKVTLSRPAKIHRNCPLVIEGHAMVDENIDDLLDQIALEVEVAMSAALVVGTRELSAQLQSTGKTLLGDNEDQVGIVRLVYTIPYVTAENTPGVIE